MDRDALVEAMAATNRPLMGCDDDAGFARCEIDDPHSCSCRIAARAALAVAEPVIQAAERERCAAVLDDWQGVPALNDYRASRKAYAVAIRALPPTR